MLLTKRACCYRGIGSSTVIQQGGKARKQLALVIRKRRRTLKVVSVVLATKQWQGHDTPLVVHVSMQHVCMQRMSLNR